MPKQSAFSKCSMVLVRGGLITAYIAVAMALPLAVAHAQTSDQPTSSGGPKLEEIVVTAERRTTNIQKTALAISAIQADTLQKSNVQQLADINGRIPSLTITRSSGYESVVTIRGVGYETPENEPTTTPGISLFIDGVYIANTISLDQTLFDVDHIEILRGPQGALYGQSSTGGAILIVTRQPVLNEYSGQADLQFGDYGLHRERAEINIPLGDMFAVRASVQNYGHDGFTKDNYYPNYYLDDANDMSGKLAVLWKPSDDFKATLTTQFYSSDFNGAAQKNILDPNPNPWTVTQDYPSRFALNTNVSHLNLEWSLPWFTVRSVTAYQYLDHHQQENSSRSAFYLLGAYDDVAAWNTKLYNYNEEFDLISNGDTNFDWTTGIFALSQKMQQYVAEFGGTTQPTPDQLIVQPDIEEFGTTKYPNMNFGQKVVSSRQSYSWFAQGTYHFTDDLRLVGGVRVNYDGITLYTKNFGKCPTPGVDVGCNVKSSSWDMVPTWIARLEYDLTPDNMLYASFTRGYKPGGSNAPSGGLFNSIYPTFAPETNTSWEIGAKNGFFDHHLTVNVAAFYYLYKNMQFIYTDPIPYAGNLTNIPSTHIWGGEIESNYIGGPEDRLHVNTSLSVEDGAIEGNYYTLDSTIQSHIVQTNPACAFGIPPSFAGPYGQPACWAAELAAVRNVGGNMPAKMPNIMASLAISYDFDVPFGVLTPRIEYIYRGDFWQRIFAEPSVDHVPSYDLVNLNFEYIPTDSNWKIDFSVTNLFDEAGVNSRYTDPYGTYQTSQQYIAPRQITGMISYSWGGAVEPAPEPAPYVPPAAQAPAAPKSYLVFFDFNKSDLTPQATEIVDTAAKNARAGKVTQITCSGHTDTVGSDAYNMRLSRRRAESVATELEKDGIPSSEIQIVAKGKRDLLVPTGDGVREPQNRRVQIIFEGGPTS
jgi:iron complex outermembrane receptor protein